jgi:hypothetical protein
VEQARARGGLLAVQVLDQVEAQAPAAVMVGITAATAVVVTAEVILVAGAEEVVGV